jgi:hypothetical protein
MTIIRTIDVDDMEDIAIGGAMLGTGGGGDPYIGKLMAQQAIRASTGRCGSWTSWGWMTTRWSCRSA